MTKFSGYYPIVAKEQTSSSVIKFTFNAPDIAHESRPGQFIQVRTSDTYYPLWPRPFSVHDTDPETGNLTIVFKVAGCGTSQLAQKDVGQQVHLFGPLGNGFPALPLERKVILASGGIGLPPLYFLAKKSVKTGYPVGNLTFIAGGRSQEDILEKIGLLGLGIESSVCTDDGSLGFKGTVVDLLKIHLENNDEVTVYSCGPSAMLKNVDSLLISKGIPGFLSLESLMPCGYGICSGCAIKTVPPKDRGPIDDKRDYKLMRVCADGPVFNSGQVIWT